MDSIRLFVMAAVSLCRSFLMEEANREDHLIKKRQARSIRSSNLLSTRIDFVKRYRLSEELIIMLEEDLQPFLPSETRRGGLSHRTKILCALSFLAYGNYQKSIGTNVDTFMSQAATSRAIHAVVNALGQPAILKKYIKFPTSEQERNVLKERFFRQFKLPGVIGCIDGTLVAMVRPRENEDRYYCRKGYHARNALIINDADLNITHVDVKFGGATHDSFIFNNSVIKTHLEDLVARGENAYLLGDSAYPQREYMMTPCNQPQPGSPEMYYNNLQSTARNTAERTYGILKGRFRCLLVHRFLHYDPDMVARIIIACCVLHNICNRAGLPAPKLPMPLQRREEEVLQLLQRADRPRENDLESGRRARALLIDTLWRGRGRQPLSTP